MKLYEITDQYRKLESYIEEIDNVGDAEAFTQLNEWVQDTLENKAQAICCLIKELDADAEAYKAEADRLTSLRKTTENKAKRLKEYLQWNLESIGQDKLKLPLFNVSIQANPESAKVNEDLLPEGYWKIERKPDLSAIKEALKSGEQVEGAWLERTRSLRIR